MENRVRVRFKIGEIEFETEGSAEVVEHERNVFLTAILPAAVDAIVRTRGLVQERQYIEAGEHQELLSSQITGATDNLILTENVNLSRTSLASFIKDYGILNDQDFALIAAYYDEKKNGAPMFSIENIKQYYADARRTEYSNISELLRQLVKKGVIMDAPNSEVKTPKQYILTSVGIPYVESYKTKEASTEKKKATAKSKRARVKIESVYAHLSADDLNLKNYPEIKAQDSFKKQMILTMYIVFSENKGDSFSVADVQCLMTDILGLPASIDQINGILKNNRSWFKPEQDPIHKKVLRRKLLEGAKDFAREITAGYNS